MKRFLILSAVAVFLSGCGRHRQTEPGVRYVKTDTVAVYGITESAAFPGKVVATSDVNLAFRVGGPILRVPVQVGDFVRKGELLAQLDPRDYEVQLAATRAEYTRVRNEVERITALYEKGSVAPNEYDKARYGYQQIQAKYDGHKNALADTRLVAPCDGYIQKRISEPGETVGAGMPVIAMIASGTGEVEINIPSSDYIRQEQFDSYSCTIDVYPGKIFPLELIGITRKANMNQLYTVRFRVTGEERDLPGPGMSTMVSIHYKATGGRMVSIPLTAVLRSDDRSAVWVYDARSETVSLREVTLAQILTDGRAVVSEGLSGGEVVLSAGIHTVKAGQRVKVLPPVSPTNAGGML